jgi:serine/threonine-protein kinase RsbW
MEIRVVLDLPRDAVSVPVIRQILDSCLETLGVTPDTGADIALALTEACANVIQHAGPGEQYEVRVSARDSKCVIEVINAGGQRDEAASSGSETASNGNGAAPFPDGYGLDAQQPDDFALAGDPLASVAEHGRGLQIIDAVAENVQLTGNRCQGTTVHFEKTLDWLPGAAGERLLSVGADGGTRARSD